MQELIGKEVEVSANDIIYRGVLVELGETDVHLRAETGYIIIPMDSILEIKAADQFYKIDGL